MVHAEVLILTRRADRPDRTVFWKRLAWIGFDLTVFAVIILIYG